MIMHMGMFALLPQRCSACPAQAWLRQQVVFEDMPAGLLSYVQALGLVCCAHAWRVVQRTRALGLVRQQSFKLVLQRQSAIIWCLATLAP